jgi:hypothetical protein
MMDDEGITIHSEKELRFSSQEKMRIMADDFSIKSNANIVLSAAAGDGSVDIRSDHVGIYSSGDIRMCSDSGSIVLSVYGFPHIEVNFGEIIHKAAAYFKFTQTEEALVDTIVSTTSVSGTYYCGSVEVEEKPAYQTFGCPCDTLGSCGTYDSDKFITNRYLVQMNDSNMSPKGYVAPGTEIAYRHTVDPLFEQNSYQPIYAALANSNCSLNVAAVEEPIQPFNSICADRNNDYQPVPEN